MNLTKGDNPILKFKMFHFDYTDDMNGKLTIQYQHENGTEVEVELGEIIVKDYKISEDKKNLILPINPVSGNIGYIRCIPGENGYPDDLKELIYE